MEFYQRVVILILGITVLITFLLYSHSNLLLGPKATLENMVMRKQSGGDYFTLQLKKNRNYSGRQRFVNGSKYLVHTMYDLGEGNVLLFSDGMRFRKMKKVKAVSCTVNLQAGYQIKRWQADIYHCYFNRTLRDKDKLSLQMSDGVIIPSLVTWKRRREWRDEVTPCHTLCLVTTVKNQEDQINDWLNYYHYQGVKLFIIYGNNNTDNTPVLAKKHKSVMWIDWPWPKPQTETMVHGIFVTRNKCMWTLFPDLDEYLFPVAGNGSFTLEQMIPQALMWATESDKKSQLDQVNQVCFLSKDMGTSNLFEHPNKPVWEAYVHFENWWHNHDGKCAIRPERNEKLDHSIHKLTVPGKTVAMPRDTIHLVHYKWQCWKCWLKKFLIGWVSSAVHDWNRNKVDVNKPLGLWTKKPGRLDTRFRDYMRRIYPSWSHDQVKVQ